MALEMLPLKEESTGVPVVAQRLTNPTSIRERRKHLRRGHPPPPPPPPPPAPLGPPGGAANPPAPWQKDARGEITDDGRPQ